MSTQNCPKSAHNLECWFFGLSWQRTPHFNCVSRQCHLKCPWFHAIVRGKANCWWKTSQYHSASGQGSLEPTIFLVGAIDTQQREMKDISWDCSIIKELWIDPVSCLYQEKHLATRPLSCTLICRCWWWCFLGFVWHQCNLCCVKYAAKNQIRIWTLDARWGISDLSENLLHGCFPATNSCQSIITRHRFKYNYLFFWRL